MDSAIEQVTLIVNITSKFTVQKILLLLILLFILYTLEMYKFWLLVQDNLFPISSQRKNTNFVIHSNILQNRYMQLPQN